MGQTEQTEFTLLHVKVQRDGNYEFTLNWLASFASNPPTHAEVVAP